MRKTSIEDICNMNDILKAANTDLEKVIDIYSKLEDLYSYHFLGFGSSIDDHCFFELMETKVEEMKKGLDLFRQMERYFEFWIEKMKTPDANIDLAKAFD